MKIKSLTIYCSASNKIDKKFFEISKEVAEIISNYNIKVIISEITFSCKSFFRRTGATTMINEVKAALVMFEMDTSPLKVVHLLSAPLF